MTILRVLCLPGLSQNATVFQNKFAAIQKQCGKDVEFVIMEPPHIMEAGDTAGLSASGPNSTAADDLLLPRSWYEPSEDLSTYTGHMESVKAIRDLLAAQVVPFDGVLGFSQGGAVAGLVVALLERPLQFPEFLVDGKAPHPPLRFGIYISGFKPVEITLAPAFKGGKLKTPSLHVIGRNDVIVEDLRSITLIDACENPRVEWHEGGHFIPSKASWRRFFQAYFASFNPESGIVTADIISPTGSPSTSAAPTRPTSPGAGIAEE